VSLSPRKVVVVADRDVIVLALICHILTRQGYQTQPVTDPHSLGSIVESGNFDAIIVDAAVDGILDKLRKRPAIASRVIVTTAESLDVSGVWACLQRPLEFGQLVQVVRACANQNRPLTDS